VLKCSGRPNQQRQFNRPVTFGAYLSQIEADVSLAVPLALLAVLIILLAAMPWSRPHPNHLFMLELLQSQLGDESAKSNDSLSKGETVADREHGQHEC